MEDRALTEQLNGLISLLQAVGIDDTKVDHRQVKRASLALKNQGSGAPIVFPPDIPESKELNDDQIEAMILKLQQAQAQAPQLMEALQDYVESRGGGSRRQQQQAGGKKKKGTKQQQRHQQQEEEPQRQQQQQNDHDDYDEDEEDDEFDEDADYPMVGPGVSDDISVVSDMTTPTVVSSIHVHEEEQYKDMLPSMYMNHNGPGGPLMIQPPKRKNLVSQVGGRSAAAAGGVPMRVGQVARPAAGGAASAAVAGGAAAKRRQTYQETMSRLHQNPYGMNTAGPRANPNSIPVVSEEEDHSDGGNLSQSFHSSGTEENSDWIAFGDNDNGGGSDPLATSGSGQRGRSNSMDESSGNNQQKTATKKKGTKAKKGTGNARSHSPKPKKKKPGSTTIDRDGFLVSSPTKGSSKKVKDPSVNNNGLSAKSAHSSASGDGGSKPVKKKVVKKKVVKQKSNSENRERAAGVGTTKPKKSPTNKRSTSPTRR